MTKRTKMIILGVVLLAFAAIGTKPLWSGANKESVDTGEAVTPQQQTEPQATTGKTTQETPELADLLDHTFAKGKPVAVVYTYNADCCPSTKEFFDKHRAAVQQLETKYKDKVSFAWVDVALYDQTEHDKLMDLAREMEVETAPALVLLDKNRKVIKTWMGELNQTEVSKTIEQVVK